MITLVTENEVYDLMKVIGEKCEVLLLDFEMFEDWLINISTALTGFIIGKYRTMDFDFVEEYSNEELFERLLVLYGKGE